MRAAVPLRRLSRILFLAALGSICALLYSDAGRHLRFSSGHQRMTAFPLVLIGLSYVSLQLSAKRERIEMIKGLMLGIAFVLWGSEQLLPASSLVTVMDSTVVSIFVVDLSSIIVEHLRRNDHDSP